MSTAECLSSIYLKMKSSFHEETLWEILTNKMFEVLEQDERYVLRLGSAYKFNLAVGTKSEFNCANLRGSFGIWGG